MKNASVGIESEQKGIAKDAKEDVDTNVSVKKEEI